MVDVRADLSGVARALLRVGREEGVFQVTGTVGTFVDSSAVQLVRAFPTGIQLELGAFAVGASIAREVPVVALLQRGVGTASAGAVVRFSAVDSTGSPFASGAFRQVTRSDADGKASAVFTPGNTSYRGEVYISAEVDGESGLLRDEAPLEVVTP